MNISEDVSQKIYQIGGMITLVKVVMGKKGIGKTKLLIDLANRAATEETGDVVCLEGGRKLTYDISYAVRLIDICDYDLVMNYDVLYGFICGIYAQNFDVSHIFIDSLYKVSGNDDLSEAEKFIEKIDKFATKNNIKFTIMISDEEDDISENLKKYL